MEFDLGNKQLGRRHNMFNASSLKSVRMRMFLTMIPLVIEIHLALGQAPQVPHKMQFAGMTLTIRDDARREIQKDVDALTQSPRHFMIKVERAKTYFPIIEKIFEEERVPVDFKYLVLQESALISDAVSVSNAVGFWQFKDYTAIEMGMRVDKQIDERMNIVSASRGAARYIKKNNFFFNNWLYALQAYQMGAGAVMQTVKDTESGAKHMEITSKTYWYVKKYLAHKIAFEGAVNGPGQLQLTTVENKTKKSLADLAKEISIEETTLRDYNKWVKSGIIPEDRIYAVLIPVAGNDNQMKLPSTAISASGALAAATAGVSISALAIKGDNLRINGLQTIVASEGDNAVSLAARAGVDLSDFLAWNDVAINEPIRPGQHYFLAKKRGRASEAYHNVRVGESLWMISQKYGVQLKRLQRYNRLESRGSIKPGETLWLSSKRPKDSGKLNEAVEVVEVDSEQAFSWMADPVVEPVVVEEKVDKADSIEPEIEKTSKMEPDTLIITTETQQMSPPVSVLPETFQKDSVFSITVQKSPHIVQAGETLYSIARQNNVGVMDLVNWNGLNLQDGIRPGQVLNLFDNQSVTPNQTSPQNQGSTEIIHEVGLNDTLYSVARKYGVTIKEIMEWNEKKDFSVSVGEKLRIIRK